MLALFLSDDFLSLRFLAIMSWPDENELSLDPYDLYELPWFEWLLSLELDSFIVLYKWLFGLLFIWSLLKGFDFDVSGGTKESYDWFESTSLSASRSCMPQMKWGC